MRLNAARQSTEVVAAFQAADDAALCVLVGRGALAWVIALAAAWATISAAANAGRLGHSPLLVGAAGLGSLGAGFAQSTTFSLSAASGAALPPTANMAR